MDGGPARPEGPPAGNIVQQVPRPADPGRIAGAIPFPLPVNNERLLPRYDFENFRVHRRDIWPHIHFSSSSSESTDDSDNSNDAFANRRGILDGRYETPALHCDKVTTTKIVRLLSSSPPPPSTIDLNPPVAPRHQRLWARTRPPADQVGEYDTDEDEEEEPVPRVRRPARGGLARRGVAPPARPVPVVQPAPSRDPEAAPVVQEEAGPSSSNQPARVAQEPDEQGAGPSQAGEEMPRQASPEAAEHNDAQEERSNHPQPVQRGS